MVVVNLTAQSLVEKFWRGVTNGGYVGHGGNICNRESCKTSESIIRYFMVVERWCFEGEKAQKGLSFFAASLKPSATFKTYSSIYMDGLFLRWR